MSSTGCAWHLVYKCGIRNLGFPQHHTYIWFTTNISLSTRQYGEVTKYNATHLRRESFYVLPPAHWELLASPPFSVLDTLDAVDDAIDANAKIVSSIQRKFIYPIDPLLPFPRRNPDTGRDIVPVPQYRLRRKDFRPITIMMRLLYRDWSVEGAAEHQSCHNLVLQQLDAEFPRDPSQRNQVKVLVPFAGLGRLVFDVCCAGFEAEGCDISFQAVLASRYIVRHMSTDRQMEMYLWALDFSNRWSRRDQLRGVKIPDVDPRSELEKASVGQAVDAFARIRLRRADFFTFYGQKEAQEMFDAVCTTFCIDAIPNMLRCIETVRHCLKSGGLWINVGPLDFSLAGNVVDGPTLVNYGNGVVKPEPGPGRDGGRVELSNEEVLLLLQHYGFQLETPPQVGGEPMSYLNDPGSMLQSQYRVSQWRARKRTGMGMEMRG